MYELCHLGSHTPAPLPRGLHADSLPALEAAGILPVQCAGGEGDWRLALEEAAGQLQRVRLQTPPPLR